MNNKIDKINAEIQKQLSYILNYDIKDPRINAFITVVKVNTTTDLKQSKVYLSVMSNTDTKPAEVVKLIQKASGFIRSELKSKLDIRNIPEMFFVLDDSIEYGMKIEQIIKDIHKNDN